MMLFKHTLSDDGMVLSGPASFQRHEYNRKMGCNTNPFCESLSELATALSRRL